MKFCTHCGAEMEDSYVFCPRCGTRCAVDRPADSPQPSADNPQTQSSPEPSGNSFPLKWHRFLMVVMILGGIVTIANGINTMAGTIHTEAGMSADSVYSIFPKLKSWDTFYGVALIALGVFEFIVRSRLKGFRASGPFSMKVMYILSIAASLVYLAAASGITGTNLFDSSNIGPLITSLCLLMINSAYYGKRSELFVN